MPTNHYEQVDFDSLEMAEKILSHEIPSTPETYEAVKTWYGDDFAKAGLDLAYQYGRYAKTLESVVEAQEAVIALAK